MPKKAGFIITILALFGLMYADIPPGYYNSASGLTGTALKNALHNIIDDHNTISYDDCWDGLMDTDEDPNNPNNIIEFYTGRSQAKNSNGGDVNDWNREHIWPQSHGDFGTSQGEGTDLHHLRPSDASVNSTRGNMDFGNVTGGTIVNDLGYYAGEYGGGVWEPREEIRGDVARMVFYMDVRYQGDSGECNLEMVDGTSDTSSGTMGYLGIRSHLLQWHVQDPPNADEIERNEVVYSIQGNRNPFIDHPEYAAAIWGGSAVVPPTVSTLTAGSVATTTAILNGNVTADGGAAVSNRGFYYAKTSVNSNPQSGGSGVTTIAAGSGLGAFNTSLTNLVPGTQYSFRAFATNSSGTGSGTVQTFTTSALQTPQAGNATGNTQTAFTANWSSVDGASSYKLDVANAPTFSPGGSGSLLSEDFTNGVPSTWTDSGTATDNVTTHAGLAIPCRALGTADYLITPAVNNPRQLSFFVDASNAGNGQNASVDYRIGAGAWTSLGSFAVSTTGFTKTFDLTTNPNLSTQQGVSFRFNSTFNTWYLDDVAISGASGGSEIIDGYNDLNVGNTTSWLVNSNLQPNTQYYYRVRAVWTNGTETATTVSSSVMGTATTPATITSPVSTATENTLTVYGTLQSGGNGTIGQSGFCWGPFSAPDPTIEGAHSTNGPTTPGNFSGSITGLQPQTLYKVRTFATNQGGVGYGNTAILMTASSGGGGSSGSGSVDGHSTGVTVPLPEVFLGGALTFPGVFIDGTQGPGDFTFSVSDSTPSGLSGTTLVWRFSGPGEIFTADTFRLIHRGYGRTMNRGAYSLDNGVTWTMIGGQYGQISQAVTDSTTISGFNPQPFGRQDVLIVLGDENAILPEEFASFVATVGENLFVDLTWITPRESDCLGFNVLRGTDDILANASIINTGIIPGTNTNAPHQYTYQDQETSTGAVYRYWIGKVLADGHTSYYGPVCVTVAVGTEDPTVPTPVLTARLLPVFPNPFNPSTTVQFSLPTNTRVDLVVYNIRGERVRTLVNGEYRNAGEHQVVWNGVSDKGQSCSSGVYFFRLHTDTGNGVVRGLLVK